MIEYRFVSYKNAYFFLPNMTNFLVPIEKFKYLLFFTENITD